MYRFTHLNRTLSPRNRYHQILAVVVAGSFFLEIGNGLGSAIRAAGAAGLAWAIGRELHPDNQIPALVAAVGAGLFEAALGGIQLGALYVILVFLRVLVRTTGASPTRLDLAVNLGVVVFVSNTTIGLIASLGLATALYLSPMLPKPGQPALKLWAAAYAIFALVGFVYSPAPDVPESTGAGWLLLVVAVMLSVGLLPETRPTSVGDIDKEQLDGARLRLARIEIVTLLVVIAAATGGVGNVMAAPALWAVGTAGVSAFRESISA